MKTGPGPYRRVADGELRDIFYLKPQTAKVAWYFPKFLTNATPPPGSDKPVVTGLLRAFLYVIANPAQSADLRREIERQLPDRNDIAIRAKLLSLMQQIREKPWAFPACYATPACRQMYGQLKPIQEVSDAAGNIMSDPGSLAGEAAGGALAKKALKDRVKKETLGVVGAWAGVGLALTNYFGSQSSDHYEFYMKRISDELALRGVPPSSL